MYKDIFKDIFIDGHKRLDLVKNFANFLKQMKELKPFLVKFNKDNIMKSKVYLPNCIIKGRNFWSIMIITYDEYIFFAKDKI